MRLLLERLWDGSAYVHVKEHHVRLWPGDHLVVHHTDTDGKKSYYELSFHEVTREQAEA